MKRVSLSGKPFRQISDQGESARIQSGHYQHSSGIRRKHGRGRAQCRKEGFAQLAHFHGGFLEVERVAVGHYHVGPSPADLH